MAQDGLMLPETGSVLGVDVGWSLHQRSSAACRLDWDRGSVGWTIRRFTADAADRREALLATAGSHHLLAAAFDGPLRGDLGLIDTYRLAERRLSERAIREAIGKLAQSNSGNGRLLNAATNACADIVLGRGLIAAAEHAHRIHPQTVVEAFPNSFLGLMLADPAPLKGGRGKRSDRYYTALAKDGTLAALMQHHLPGRRVEQSFESVTNHDDRAALVCAITALGVARNDYVTVGDTDGWIILPPRDFIANWAQPLVAAWN
jgi:hypothetical protein